jgi:uncharacterized protein
MVSPALRMVVLLLVALTTVVSLRAETADTSTTSPVEVIPPAPRSFVTDEAGVMTAAKVQELSRQLEQFENDTTNQIVVAIYPTKRSNRELADYSRRVANAWRVGQKGKNNGVVLLIFTKDRQLYISVGSGLEAALPNELCQRIIDEEITPAFKRGEFDGGVSAGAKAIMAATSGKPAAESK